MMTTAPGDQLAELGALARRLLVDIEQHDHDTARARLAQEVRMLSDEAIAVLNEHDGPRVLVEPPADNTEFELAVRHLAGTLGTMPPPLG